MMKPPTSPRKVRIGVLGPGDADGNALTAAEAVGVEIARAGAILVCGGLGGAMEAAARGAKWEGGLTVGILPGIEAQDANPFIDVPIVTGLGEARNVLVVRSCDVVIAISGSYGTLSEIALALKIGVPVVGLGTWHPRDPEGNEVPIQRADSPRDAVALSLSLIKE